MARKKITNNKNFQKYEEYIKEHDNYKNLDFGRNWIATKKSKVGSNRIKWCEEKAEKIKINIKKPYYSKVMLKIHPLKYKVCQVCGKIMWLYYMYPNKIFLKKLNDKFSKRFNECDSINKIWNFFKNKDKDNLKKFEDFIISEFKIKILNKDKIKLIKKIEIKCRKEGKNFLGPGAMSNFPDRFDGFHTYNRCCRTVSDKGRSKENLKTYNTDRRAYENWSDGNICAANKLMGSKFFKDTSADHIGPISLGFVHDPRYLQSMSKNENSAKRDRLELKDIEKIIEIEKATKILPVSWFCKEIWCYIKGDFLKKKENSNFELYREILKKNMNIFFKILYTILTESDGCGEPFLVQTFLKPNYSSFDFNYTFVEKDSFYDIKTQKPRNRTDSSLREFDRYIKIAIESVHEYNSKENRKAKVQISEDEKKDMKEICTCIKNMIQYNIIKSRLCVLVRNVQIRIIEESLEQNHQH